MIIVKEQTISPPSPPFPLLNESKIVIKKGDRLTFDTNYHGVTPHIASGVFTGQKSRFAGHGNPSGDLFYTVILDSNKKEYKVVDNSIETVNGKRVTYADIQEAAYSSSGGRVPPKEWIRFFYNREFKSAILYVNNKMKASLMGKGVEVMMIPGGGDCTIRDNTGSGFFMNARELVDVTKIESSGMLLVGMIFKNNERVDLKK